MAFGNVGDKEDGGAAGNGAHCSIRAKTTVADDDNAKKNGKNLRASERLARVNIRRAPPRDNERIKRARGSGGSSSSGGSGGGSGGGCCGVSSLDRVRGCRRPRRLLPIHTRARACARATATIIRLLTRTRAV